MEEPKDRFGREENFWVTWRNEARKRLTRTGNDSHRLLREYREAHKDWGNAVSTAQRIGYRNEKESLKVEMERRREVLGIKIPQAAASAGAPAEWVQ